MIKNQHEMHMRAGGILTNTQPCNGPADKERCQGYHSAAPSGALGHYNWTLAHQGLVSPSLGVQDAMAITARADLHDGVLHWREGRCIPL